MTLSAGSRLGPYEIASQIGAGGMGEVFRARDTKLNRDVAIKVLPAGFADDKERVARFRREAQLVASLNHPNIAAIYGLEESSGTVASVGPGGAASAEPPIVALVLELVDGEDLAQRLARGAVPPDEAIAIGKQIAEGLEAAHEKGVVHRDLKPANIKLTRDGVVKILDFGLAKAFEEDASRDGGLTESPTMSRNMTEAGMILGTAAYMSPEQARGQPVDKRSDVWSFGVVLYELLTARRMFSGETVSDTLAAVLRQDVDLGPLPPSTPGAIRSLLGRCLVRNARSRLRDIGDARIVLESVMAGAADDPSPAAPAPRSRGRIALVAAACVVIGAVAGGLAGWRRGIAGISGAAPATFERLTFQQGYFLNARFAPDGQTAFLAAAWRGNAREVFQVRPRAGELSLGLPGVELLSVSRSGELAILIPRVRTGNPYIQSGTLAVVSASGGTPRELAENVSEADWAPDGSKVAVIRNIGTSRQLEFPLGTVLYKVPLEAVSPRVSPAGDEVAFIEREPTGLNSLVVVDRSGKRTVWSPGWSDWWSLAWAPDGREIWLSASHVGVAANVYAVERGGRTRTLVSAPGSLVIQDIASDGSALLSQVEMVLHVIVHGAAGSRERDLSWLEASAAADLSTDGRKVLLRVDSEREAGGPAVFLRSTDGSPPVRLGSGNAQELSRDGSQALAVRGGTVVAMPTAAGAERTLDTKSPRVLAARWLPDGASVLVFAAEPDGKTVASIVGFGGGVARRLSETFELRLAARSNRLVSPVSPDGHSVAVALANGSISVLPLEGGPLRPVTGASPGETPIQWTTDGRGLYVFAPGTSPAGIFEVDVASGRRRLVREVAPEDKVGVPGILQVLITSDGATAVSSYQQYRSVLYLAKGLR